MIDLIKFLNMSLWRISYSRLMRGTIIFDALDSIACHDWEYPRCKHLHPAATSASDLLSEEAGVRAVIAGGKLLWETVHVHRYVAVDVLVVFVRISIICQSSSNGCFVRWRADNWLDGLATALEQHRQLPFMYLGMTYQDFELGGTI